MAQFRWQTPIPSRLFSRVSHQPPRPGPRRLVTPPPPPVSRHLQGLRPLLEPPHHVTGSASQGSQPPAPSHPHPLPSRQPPKFSAFPTISPPGLSCSLLRPQHAASHHPLKGADHLNIASAHHLPEQENSSPARGRPAHEPCSNTNTPDRPQRATVALSAEGPAVNQHRRGWGQWLHSGASEEGNWHTHGCPT